MRALFGRSAEPRPRNHLALQEGPAAIHDPHAVAHGTERVAPPHELAALLHAQVGENLERFDSGRGRGTRYRTCAAVTQRGGQRAGARACHDESIGERLSSMDNRGARERRRSTSSRCLREDQRGGLSPARPGAVKRTAHQEAFSVAGSNSGLGREMRAAAR